MGKQFPKVEVLKKRGNAIGEFIKAKYGIDVKHGHCLELMAIALTGQNWNVLAAYADKGKSIPQSVRIGDAAEAMLKGFKPVVVYKSYRTSKEVGTYETSDIEFTVDEEKREVVMMLPPDPMGLGGNVPPWFVPRNKPLPKKEDQP